MKYDPEARKAKYTPLLDALALDGFTGAVATDSNRQDGAVIRHPDADGFVLFVCSRLRGWYVHFPRKSEFRARICRIPTLESLVVVMRTLLNDKRDLVNQPTEELARQLGLTVVDSWLRDEMQEDAERWKKYGWQELLESEVGEIGDRYQPYFFAIDELTLPSPSLSWQILDTSRIARDEQDQIESVASMHTLAAFQRCLVQEGEVLVLDWHSSCYRWNVHQGIRSAYREQWAAPVASAGDDVAFVTPDFRLGLFSFRDGWLHVFGSPFLETFLQDIPAEIKPT